ncbi:uracil-DNA glycosylase [uncultured Phascolarctobacterium sp.]|uniref:uracil-DNA glycosylase n=1 Tax=uncultured Phascolarctobacterium sp. TaxID=512296 RepID=UPI0025D18BF7|nr:uracil-DNA glycosylase [uncultured Phascolarctobacterium sp.]
MDINTFIDKLQSYQGELVFNPWRDYDAGCDIGPQAPAVRRANLRRYLELRTQAHYLFIAEALGYQGGHFSGVAITSERILLGQHADIAPESVLGAWDYRRTSNSASSLLNNSQKQKGFNEPTDTVVWNALNRHGLAAFDVILWNIFPFHPYKAGKLLSNRTPTAAELDIGVEYAKMLLELVPNMKIVAIGQKAAITLERYGIDCMAVPHPSMGGANRFKAAAEQLFGGGGHG